MKKLISIILAIATLASLLSLVSCESQVKLTKDNYNEYIGFNITFDELVIYNEREPLAETEGLSKFYSASCNAHVTTYAKGDYTFSNVKIAYKYNAGAWGYSPVCTVTLMQNGNSSSSFGLNKKMCTYPTLPYTQIEGTSSGTLYNYTTKFFEIVAIEGTITKK